MIAKHHSYFGTSFKAERLVCQRDIVSPTILYRVNDALIRHFKERLIKDGKIAIQFFIKGYNHDANVQNARKVSILLISNIKHKK